MEKNKTGKYFKYAIGEIILVMIGILLALQVSNWNNQSTDRKLEKRYLSELILDLQTDSIVIYEAKKYSDKQVLAKRKLEKHFEGKQITEDSLLSYFGNQWRHASKFNPITTTLDEMKSTGNIGVIQNTAIRRKILETYNYYTTHINEERYIIQQNALAGHIQSSIPNIFSEFLESSKALDIKILLDDFQVENGFLGNGVKGFNSAIDALQSKNIELLSALRVEYKKLD
jgi:primosomal protein N'